MTFYILYLFKTTKEPYANNLDPDETASSFERHWNTLKNEADEK